MMDSATRLNVTVMLAWLAYLMGAAAGAWEPTILLWFMGVVGLPTS